MLAAPDRILERLQRATAALAEAELRNPLGEDVDPLVDETIDARVAVRRARMDQAWVDAERYLDDLAHGSVIPTQAIISGEAMPWWLVVRLATGVLMEKYELDKNHAVALLARTSERNQLPAELLAERILRADRDLFV
jgi:hypothetical protein